MCQQLDEGHSSGVENKINKEIHKHNTSIMIFASVCVDVRAIIFIVVIVIVLTRARSHHSSLSVPYVAVIRRTADPTACRQVHTLEHTLEHTAVHDMAHAMVHARVNAIDLHPRHVKIIEDRVSRLMDML